MTRLTISLAALCGFTMFALADDEAAVKKATELLQKKDYKAARAAAEAIVKADPKSAEGYAILGLAAFSVRDNAPAVEAFTALLKLDPKSILALDRRGDAYLKLGKFEESVKDFDAVLELKPAYAPEHWRRGIALYYVGRHKDGAKQFETHKTANPQDVENAAWHYLCNAKVIGKEKALKELIDVTQDTRVPMKEIQKLFAGSLKPADVMAAAEKVKADTEEGTEARFYGNLYVGLWYESEGNAAKAKEHLTAAVEKYKIGHYMWDVGNAHLAWLAKKK